MKHGGWVGAAYSSLFGWLEIGKERLWWLSLFWSGLV